MKKENKKNLPNGSIKNILLVMSLLLVLFSPIFGAEISFYVAALFVVLSAIYMMLKRNLTLKNDRIVVLFLISMLVATATAFSLKYFL